MPAWPPELQDVPFDHDAAARATRAIEEVLRRLDDAEERRAQLIGLILCTCSGPFAEHLAAEVAAGVAEVAWVVERLRHARARIGRAVDAALMEQVRRELRRDDWLAEQAAVTTAG